MKNIKIEHIIFHSENRIQIHEDFFTRNDLINPKISNKTLKRTIKAFNQTKALKYSFNTDPNVILDDFNECLKFIQI
jgi:hypothetical protein